MEREQTRKKGLAITSLVLAVIAVIPLLGIVTAPLAVLFALIALLKAGRRPEKYAGKGFAIAGLCVGSFMIFIILIMIAIAIPSFIKTLGRGRQMQNMGDIRTAATAVEAFAVDNGKYPGPTNGYIEICALRGQLEPTYIKSLPCRDGWNNPLLYSCPGDQSRYRIVSNGKDGMQDRPYDDVVEQRQTTNFNDDIIFDTGSYIQWPAGALR